MISLKDDGDSISLKDYLVQEFLQSDVSVDLWSCDFWSTNFPSKPTDIVSNGSAKEGFKELYYKPVYYESGKLCKNVVEFDFNAFSFNILKKYAEDDVLMVCDLVDELNDEFRESEEFVLKIKRLRIALFNSLINVRCAFFNPVLYKKVQEEMYANMSRLVALIRKSGLNIIAIGYDSVTVDDVNSKDAYESVKEIFSLWDGVKFKVREFSKILRFYNILLYGLNDGKYKVSYFNKYKESYDNLKLDIAYHLVGELEHIDWKSYEGKVSDKKLAEYKQEVEKFGGKKEKD